MSRWARNPAVFGCIFSTALVLAATTAGCGATYKFELVKGDSPPCEVTSRSARVYFLRGTSVGLTDPFGVWANCEFLGVTKGRSYFCAHLPPGPTELMVKAGRYSVMTVDLEAGGTYYIGTAERMGLGRSRAELQRVEADMAERLIAEGMRYIRTDEAATPEQLKSCPSIGVAPDVSTTPVPPTPGKIPPVETMPASRPSEDEMAEPKKEDEEKEDEEKRPDGPRDPFD